MEKESYRVDEVAKKLEVSRRTIERAIQRGELQAFKIRHNLRIDHEELERLKKSGVVK